MNLRIHYQDSEEENANAHWEISLPGQQRGKRDMCFRTQHQVRKQ